PFGDRAHVLLLLRLGAVGEDAVRRDVFADRAAGRVGRVGRGHLDHGQHVGHRLHAGTAVLGGHLDAHQAVLAQDPDVLERELAGAVVVFGAGSDLLAGDPARDVLDHQLLFVEPEFHDGLVWFPEKRIVAGRASEPHAQPARRVCRPRRGRPAWRPEPCPGEYLYIAIWRYVWTWRPGPPGSRCWPTPPACACWRCWRARNSPWPSSPPSPAWPSRGSRPTWPSSRTPAWSATAAPA